jgi:hypothetical protein
MQFSPTFRIFSLTFLVRQNAICSDIYCQAVSTQKYTKENIKKKWGKKERRKIILSKGIFITLLLRVMKHHCTLICFLKNNNNEKCLLNG